MTLDRQVAPWCSLRDLGPWRLSGGHWPITRGSPVSWAVLDRRLPGQPRRLTSQTSQAVWRARVPIPGGLVNGTHLPSYRSRSPTSREMLAQDPMPPSGVPGSQASSTWARPLHQPAWNLGCGTWGWGSFTAIHPPGDPVTAVVRRGSSRPLGGIQHRMWRSPRRCERTCWPRSGHRRLVRRCRSPRSPTSATHGPWRTRAP